VDARLDSNPDATNTGLAAAVHHKVAHRTISDVLARRERTLSRKHYIDREPAEATEVKVSDNATHRGWPLTSTSRSTR